MSQTLFADVLAKCSLKNRKKALTGINLVLSNDSANSTARSNIFLNSVLKGKLNGQYTTAIKKEATYYGNNINTPGDIKAVKIVSVDAKNSDYNLSITLRLSTSQINDRVTGSTTVTKNKKVIIKNEPIICDLENTLQE
jgi:hypothetical protein